MSLNVTGTVSAADLVRFTGPEREDGLVGTFSIDVGATGDASGNPLTVIAQMQRGVWGFPALLVTHAMSVNAVAQDPGFANLGYLAVGNRRIQGDLRFATDFILVDNDYWMTESVIPRIIVEPTEALASIFVTTFATNADTKVYHLHVAGLVYDLNQLVKSGAYAGVAGNI